jgi:hypothetical protein
LKNDKLWEKLPQVLILFVLGAMFLVLLVNGIPIRQSDQKWEYTVIFNVDTEVDENLNKSGENRWEVTWCRRARSSSKLLPKWGYECLLKRPSKK